MPIVENQGYIIAPFVMASVNKHDSVLIPESMWIFKTFADDIGLNLHHVPITFDSGFDGRDNKASIRSIGLIPVIYPNKRNTKNPILIARMFRWFDRDTYKKRYAVERTFAWEDTYRRLVTSYERLRATQKGFRYLAYSLINLRNSL